MDSLPNPFILLAGMSILALAPFLAIMVSSYIKIVVVLYILRNGLGLPQVPPNMAVNGLAIILSLYIMAPVGFAMSDAFSRHDVKLDNFQDPALYEAVTDGVQPLVAFLKKHSDENERRFFAQTTKKLWPKDKADAVTEDHVLVLLPSFTISELKSAFQIGFLLYLPFIVIDLIVSNILLAMGMIMVSPMMISLPFKILLFVMADGWTRLIHGLVLSYQ
jgi:type III secretion protein R